jgi:Holliday junction resolvase RusA-like endonuclease
MSWDLFVAFDVLGIPKAQPRAKAFARGGHAAVYNPATAEGWKGCIALAAREHLPRVPLDCPIRLGLTVFFPRPKYMLARKYPGGAILHTAKPDSDNTKKAVMDALTQIGMWRDDALVCSWFGDKYYAARGQASGALIQIFVHKED